MVTTLWQIFKSAIQNMIGIFIFVTSMLSSMFTLSQHRTCVYIPITFFLHSFFLLSLFPSLLLAAHLSTRPSLPLSSPAHQSQHRFFYAYLFITALPIKDLPCKVQQEWNTANSQTSLGFICMKPEIISGVNTRLIGDTSLNLGNDIQFMWDFGDSYEKQCTYFKSF